MTASAGESEIEVAAIIDSFDALVDQIERHLASLTGEQTRAASTGDPHYKKRVERGISGSQKLVDLLYEDALELIMSLRHNARQLTTAREGKMV